MQGVLKMIEVKIKGQTVEEWVEWVENELEEPRTIPDETAYVLESFLESLSAIEQLTSKFTTTNNNSL
jgi:hypothetical protein